VVVPSEIRAMDATLTSSSAQKVLATAIFQLGQAGAWMMFSSMLVKL